MSCDMYSFHDCGLYGGIIILTYNDNYSGDVWLLHQSSYLVVDCHAAWETTDNSCNVTAPIFGNVQSQMQLSWMRTEALFETQDELVLVVSSRMGMING
ncbi:hypothetical protein POPTR_016G063450v4 [Populus trichocarpa]|uniref:Uncharacterized protein n=1 Tax=Populus trichocarpa TaxID=3694 RepID=A0ACC0RTA0_POPTR|nr:hypothetical protein POPTR_016G063450v4 [Populus trichocarpa]